MIGQVHAAGQHGRTLGLVSRSSVESLRRELDSAIGVSTAAQRLGVGRHAALDFIRDDVLRRAVRTSAGWKIPVRSVEDLEAFCDRQPPIEGDASCWVSLRQATRIAGPSGLSMNHILKRILAGSLAVRMADCQLGLNGIVVSHSDLAIAQQEVRNQCDRSSDWSLYRTAQKLFPDQPMKPRVLQKWIQQGLLPAKKKGRRTVITGDAIENFRADFCLAQEAAQILSMSRSTLSRWEQQGRIRPVYGKRVTPGAGFSLYRRADLQQLLEDWP